MRNQDRNALKKTARQVNSTVKLVSTLTIGGFGLMMIFQASPRFQKKPQVPAPAVTSEAAPTESQPTQQSGEKAFAPAAQSSQAIAQATGQGLQNAAKLEFSADLERLKAQLPTRESMQKKTAAEVHDSPPEVAEIGLRLGKMKERWLQASHLRPQALQFYQDCFAGRETVVSVRALCLSNARALSTQLKADLNESEASTEVKKVADRL
jgi:hypothetical protein